MLTELDTVMGPLSLTSSMSSMVHYTRQGVHWLRMDSQKVKWPTTCRRCCCCCCWMSANPPSCLSSLSCPSGLWQSSLSSLHMNVNSSHVLEDITLIIALILIFFLMSTLVFLSLFLSLSGTFMNSGYLFYDLHLLCTFLFCKLTSWNIWESGLYSGVTLTEIGWRYKYNQNYLFFFSGCMIFTHVIVEGVLTQVLFIITTFVIFTIMSC